MNIKIIYRGQIFMNYEELSLQELKDLAKDTNTYCTCNTQCGCNTNVCSCVS